MGSFLTLIYKLKTPGLPARRRLEVEVLEVKNMPISIRTTAAAMVLGAGMLWAQSATPTPVPPSPAQREARELRVLTRELTLTAAQQTSVKTILDSSIPQMQTLQTQLKQDVETIGALIKTGDQTQFNAQIQGDANQVGSVATQMAVARATERFQIRALLTPDQQAKFDRMPLGLAIGPGGQGGPRGRAMRGPRPGNQNGELPVPPPDE